jgi:hypothetical protein
MKSRTRSVYTGQFRESVLPKRNFQAPLARGTTIPERRNRISPPKTVKNKYPPFNLLRGTTAGGMGIGLDDYIFNNSKRSEETSVRKTKATEDNSLTSRPGEKNSTFVWSRGSRNSSQKGTLLKGVNTDGQTSGVKSFNPHIGI